MRVLLTSPRAPVTLDLARRLNAYGVDVYLCDSLRFGCSRFSRAKKRFFSIPPANRNIDRYVSALNQIIATQKIDLLIPTCEEIFYLAALRNQLDCDVFVDTFEKLHTFHNKWTFSKVAENWAGQAPETFAIDRKDQLTDFKKRSADYVFKPVYSRFAAETLVRPDPDLLGKIEVNPGKPWVAQRFISGTEFSTYSIALEGNLVMHCTYRSSFRAGLGAGICFFCDPQPAITAYTKQLVQDTNFTGQLGLDCIVDLDGKVWAIECNPRATSGMHLFDEGPRLVETFLGKPHDLSEAVYRQPFMVGAAMLTFALPAAIWGGRVKAFVNDLFRSKDVLFRWSDPVPFLSIPMSVGELCWIAVRERISIQQATTWDIEWNGDPIRSAPLEQRGKGEAT